MTKVATTVLAWFADNFKILSVTTTAACIYIIANPAQFPLPPFGVGLVSLVVVILAATDPNRDHTTPPSLNVSLATPKE